MIEVSRRGLLTGIGAVLIVAPAIVRASSLMAVKVMPDEEELRQIPLSGAFIPQDDAHIRMIETVRRAFLPRLYGHYVDGADLERFAILRGRA